MANTDTEKRSKSKKEDVPLFTFSSDEERDLSWFFTTGQTVFERSTCGAMLEELERSSCVSVTCKRCRGVGILGDGLDFTDPDYGQWCSCGGTGTLPIAMKRSKLALTAKPKKANGSGNGKTPNDSDLTRYASVSRRINRLQVFAPVSVQTLCAFWGNAGTRWAQEEGRGRIFPVLALTKAGATLIKRSQGRTILQEQESDVPRDAHEQLGQLYLIEQIQSDPNRAKLFVAAFSQAEKLYDRACEDWLETVKK